jgi:hypothetical protein
MSAHPAEQRCPIHVRQALCTSAGTVMILGIATAFWIWAPLYRQEMSIAENYRSGIGLGGIPSHPLDERQQELEALIDDIECGETLTRKDVLSRLGKPDVVQETGSKEYGDRCILTTYDYDLSPGQYRFPNSERANVGSAWWAHFIFDERVNHGRRGRIYYVVDETTPPSTVAISDNDGPGGFVFPKSKRNRYEIRRPKREEG